MTVSEVVATGSDAVIAFVLDLVLGIATKEGKTVIRSADWETTLKLEFGSAELRMMFSSLSRVVIKPLAFVQYFEMMESPSFGTYQVSLSGRTEDVGEDLSKAVPLPFAYMG